MARIDRNHPIPDADAPRRLGISGEKQEGIATQPVGHPERVVAERISALGQLHRRSQVLPRIEVRAGSLHRDISFLLPSSAISVPGLSRKWTSDGSGTLSFIFTPSQTSVDP